MAQWATTALAGALPRPSVRGARGRFGGLGPVPGVVSLPFPPSRPACPALRVAGHPVRVFLPSLAGTPFHAVCAFRELGLVALLLVPACPLRVCALALRRRPPPPPWVVWRAVGAVGAGVWVWGPYTDPLARTPCGGCVPRRWWGAVPLPGLGLCAPRGAGPLRTCAGGRAWGGGGGPCAVPPVCALGGGLKGGGSLCLVPSLCLPWAGSKAGVTGVVLSMGGVAPHTSPVRARPPSLGAICAASWRVGAGSLVPRGSCGSRQLGRGGGPRSGSSLGRGEGGPSPLPRGLEAGAAAACGPVGGGEGMGRGSRRGLPASPLGRGPRFPTLAPFLSSAHPPPACACGRGRGAAPGWGGMRHGPWTAPPGAPPDLNPPSALPEWAVVMGVLWGARPPYCSGGPPCAAPRLGPRAAPARWCGLARQPRPPREQAAGGAGARAVQVQPHPPPPRHGPFWGRQGVPSAPGGRRVAPVALKLGGGEPGGGGWGGRPPAPRPVGRRPAIRCLRRAPPGCIRAVGVAGRPRASGAARSAAKGSVQRGGKPSALVRAPVFPRPSSEGAAPFALSWAPPVRRRPAAGRACGCLPRPWCPLTLGAAASSGGVRGRRLFGLPPSALGPEGEGGGGVAGALWSPGAAP